MNRTGISLGVRITPTTLIINEETRRTTIFKRMSKQKSTG